MAQCAARASSSPNHLGLRAPAGAVDATLTTGQPRPPHGTHLGTDLRALVYEAPPGIPTAASYPTQFAPGPRPPGPNATQASSHGLQLHQSLWRFPTAAVSYDTGSCNPCGESLLQL